ncbi:hypothetical protein OSB04_011107 [Centaurea solstitialis]|uniref:R13L1/DRL21-like LRR repeat region domain-containing protein n=1 Tax=Centaurea solstitialis TaxID=347529 RepID=A0AA38TTJ9_9ASTR|nr:hypothetical protein OSB04_011107 [Centaurea solstitialis]
MHARELIKKVNSELELEWSDGLTGSQAKALQKEVLIMLKPRNVTLRKLGIMSYGDIEFPNWLHDCRTCTSIPLLGKLALLKELSIQGTDGLKAVGPEILGYGLAYGRWELPSTNIENIDFVFPCLQEIHIYNCPKLVEVSLEELPSLKILKLHRSILGITNELWGGVGQHIGALEEVRLERLDEIRHLSESKAEASKILVNLRTLEVAYCENLANSGNKEEDTYGSKITSIKTLKISYCNTTDHCNYPDSIETLAIHKCISMTSSFSYPAEGGSSSRCSFRNVKKSQKMSLEEDLTIHRGQNLESIVDLVIESDIIETFDDSRVSGYERFLSLWVLASQIVLPWFREVESPWSEWGLQHFLRSLIELCLLGGPLKEDVNCLNQLFHLTPSLLHFLVIGYFEKLESLSMGLKHLKFPSKSPCTLMPKSNIYTRNFVGFAFVFGRLQMPKSNNRFV